MLTISKIKLYKNDFKSICDNYKQAYEIFDINNVRAIEFLNMDATKKIIEFKYYNNYITLRKRVNALILSRRLTSNEKTIKGIFESIGSFIALYHKNTANSKRTKFYLPEKDDREQLYHKSFLHSDLTDNNVLINKNNEVIIIDWEPAPVLKTYFNYGSVLWDIVWFSNALLRPSPGTFFFSNERIRVVKYFLSGYEKIFKLDFDLYFSYYFLKIRELNEKMYSKRNFYNTTLINRHYKNWETLKEELS